jgi:SWI/SNF-related matrix-associated actin-dependent regulator of chromatin subfamily A-like protein 1
MDSLFDFQNHGSQWLSAKRHALLADEMGLGKTVQAIKAAEKVGARRVLVVCPAIARLTWAREFKKWSETISPVAISYERATRDWQKYGAEAGARWDALILDESHYLKSLDAKRTKAIFGREGLIHYADRVWALSGTPAPNHIGELWPLLFVFGHTRLSYGEFIRTYCDLIETNYGPKVVGTKAAMVPELKRVLQFVMLRRMKRDVLKEMPPLFFSDLVVEPGFVDVEKLCAEMNAKRGGDGSALTQLIGPKDFKLALETEEKLLAEGLSNAEKMASLEALATSVATLRRYTGLQKVEPIAELVKSELELGLCEKIVIFAVHKQVVAGLAERLAEFSPVVITGETPANQRQNAVDSFQSDPRIQVFIGNIQAAGTNITLTAAHQIIFAEQDWTPGNNAQAAMRCHRIGQERAVSVRFVALANPVDEKVTSVLRRKAKDLAKIFDS